MFYVAFIIFIDFFSLKNRYQLASQIKQSLGIDPSGVIPHITELKQSDILSINFLKNKVLIDSLKKTIIKLLKESKIKNNAFIISSPMVSDGKTLSTILFGLVANEMNKKVLLIDTDEEKKNLSKTFLRFALKYE